MEWPLVESQTYILSARARGHKRPRRGCAIPIIPSPHYRFAKREHTCASGQACCGIERLSLSCRSHLFSMSRVSFHGVGVILRPSAFCQAEESLFHLPWLTERSFDRRGDGLRMTVTLVLSVWGRPPPLGAQVPPA